MYLARRLDQVLEVSTREKVAQVDKFAVLLVLHVDRTPSILTGWNCATVRH